MSVPITVSPVSSSSSSPPLSRKPPPQPTATTLKFQYSPSRDGKDRNLLILFHGLGDTSQPFFELGKKLNLPETAIMAVQAPLQIPLLDEPSFMFYPSFTIPDFTPILNPNPSSILSLLSLLLTHLTSPACGSWPLSSIHLFGFGQGGSVAAELALLLTSKTRNNNSSADQGTRLGSLVTVSGPLLSLPTPPPGMENKNQTPVLALHRSGEAYSKADLGAFGKGFREVKEVRFVAGQQGMVKGEGEWRVVMKFWSEHLEREGRMGMGGGGEMFEVLEGGPKMG